MTNQFQYIYLRALINFNKFHYHAINPPTSSRTLPKALNALYKEVESDSEKEQESAVDRVVRERKIMKWLNKQNNERKILLR